MGGPWGEPLALGGPLGGPSGLGWTYRTYLSLCLSPGARGPGARRYQLRPLRPRPNRHTRTRAAQPARSYFARLGPATPRGVQRAWRRAPRRVQRVWRRAPRCVQRVWRRAPRGASLSAPPPFCHGLVLLGLGLVLGTGSGRGGGNFPRASFPYSLPDPTANGMPDTTATTNGLLHTERIFIKVAFGRGWY